MLPQGLSMIFYLMRESEWAPGVCCFIASRVNIVFLFQYVRICLDGHSSLKLHRFYSGLLTGIQTKLYKH
jgi:hypothetical protein